MGALALGWWLSLVADAAQGRIAWLAVALALCVLLAWAVPMARWARALRPQQARLVAWHPPALRRADPSGQAGTPVRWTDAQGDPLELHVRLDLGAGMLLQVCPQGAPAPKAPRSQWRWVGAQALAGPWRWRLVAAASQGAARNDEASERSKMASWTLFAPQKARLPKSARRPA